MKTPEYVEGPEALENFKTLETAILQTPRKEKKQPKKKAASQETEQKSDKDWKGIGVSPPLSFRSAGSIGLICSTVNRQRSAQPFK